MMAKTGEQVLRAAVWGSGLLVASVIVIVALTPRPQVGEVEMLSGQTGEITHSRLITVSDQSDGTLRIEDAATGELLEKVGRDSNGFIRGALRGLARDRVLRGIGSGEPFRLRLWEDGTFVLDDPVVGGQVALNGFGQENARAFGKYLAAVDQAGGGLNSVGAGVN